MLTISEKKAYLQWIRRCRPDEEAILEEIETLRAKRMSASAGIGDGTPRGSSGNGDLAAYAAQLDALERKLSAHVRRYLQARNCLEEDILRMDSATEAAVIRLYYIAGKTWHDVAEAIGYEERQTFRIHGMALLHIDIHRIEVKKRLR